MPPIPFAELFAPVVADALERLEAEAGDVWDALSDAARRDLAQDLTHRLSVATRRGIQPLYERARARIRQADPLRVLDPSGRAVYRAFVASVHASGFRDLFEPAPVLEHILATTTAHWTEAAHAVLDAWHTDRNGIESHFGICARRPVEIAGSRSDLHDGGRTVWILRFASGERLVYKPRSLAPEAALRTWLHRVDPTLAACQPRGLDRGTYGWCAFAAPSACPSEAAVEAAFQRSGGLLAVAAVLGLSDLHAENVVATANGPAVLDAETLARPDLRPPAAASPAPPLHPAVQAAHERLEDSVLATGLLPAWHVLEDGRPYDASALGRDARTPEPLRQHTWTAVNRDAMAPVARAARPAPAGNTVFRGDTPVAAAAHGEALAAGFQAAYRTLCAEREALLAPGGAVDRLAEVPTRVLIRPTRVYHRLRLRALRPDALRNASAWTAQHARLGGAGSDPRWAPVIAAERAAMRRGDVPVFRTPAGAPALQLDDAGTAADVLRRSGVDRVRARLAAMGAEDEDRQVAWIRAALAARTASVTWRSVPRPRPPADPFTAGPPPAAALRLAAHWARTAVRAGDGATWIGLHVHPDADVWTLGPLPPALSGGLGGTVLALAEIAVRARRDDWIALARAARRTLTAECRRMDDRAADPWAHGPDGVRYALAAAGRWLGASNAGPLPDDALPDTVRRAEGLPDTVRRAEGLPDTPMPKGLAAFIPGATDP